LLPNEEKKSTSNGFHVFIIEIWIEVDLRGKRIVVRGRKLKATMLLY
jgi:hypothetical protein